ncbi:NADH:flavin oxidoreductase [Streptomyces sp. MBT62]|uniref:oxidoreductase n=1 Tax=Streptomyces sp. MBT62 TaxID=2800410 RepID=UPI00190B71F4|nr:NADH:flavin oxidoreductase [Streptomyces sp. MBT62]MBK3567994.1 NADH:flavin oxidoreductase [Streptomyces sp. MBT62]
MSTPPTSPLLRPLRIGTLTVPGRLFKSATSETRATDDGYVTDELLEFYEPMVRAGTPLIVTGNLYVSLQSKSAGRQAGIDADDKKAGLRDWVDLAHSGGSLLIAQLNHGGRQMVRSADPGEAPVSASAVREPLYGTKPRPLRQDEIPGVVETFAAAAERARDVGFDGVQIHAAHGYLLSQFLTPHTNRRTDEYGGGLDNRMRLLREVFRAIRTRVGDDFPVLLKLNGTDMLPLRRGATTAELVRVAEVLEGEGIDAVEISRAHYESWPGMILGHYKGFIRGQITEGSGMSMTRRRRLAMLAAAPVVERVAERLAPGGEGFNLPQAEQFTARLDIPVICVGGFHTREGMESAIDSGRCDAVSAARAMIADPFLFKNMQDPAPDRPVCEYRNGCIARFGGKPIDCYVEPIRIQKNHMLRRTEQA